MKEQIQGIFNRLNRADFLRFQALSTEILKLSAPSLNPDTFTDLSNALKQTEENLKVSLKQE